MPRAALLSIHARVDGAEPTSWAHESFVQVWGPRYSTYVIAAQDIAVFTLSRLPEEGTKARARAEHMAALIRGEPGAEPADSYALRYATSTGTVLIHWDGARRPTLRSVPPPDVDPFAARLELARRYLHVFGPATVESFERWAGIGKKQAVTAFGSLADELTAARTPIGEGYVLSADEPELRRDAGPESGVRFLPSGDTYFLLQGADRELLVPDAQRRDELWTPRVWPGALLIDGEIRGVWRRAHHAVTIDPWGRLGARTRAAIKAEAATLPLPGLTREITVEYA